MNKEDLSKLPNSSDKPTPDKKTSVLPYVIAGASFGSFFGPVGGPIIGAIAGGAIGVALLGTTISKEEK